MNKLKRKVREWQYRREANHVLAGRLAAADHRISMLEVAVVDQEDRAQEAEKDALRWKTRYVGHVSGVNQATAAAIQEARAEGRSVALLAAMRVGEQVG